MDNKIPTLIELKDLIASNKLPYPPSDTLLLQVIEIITYSDNFRSYLIENKHDKDYDLPYTIFWEIIGYLKYCYDKEDHCSILNILRYIEGLLNTKNEEILDLVVVGFLEDLHTYKWNLIDLLELFPIDLKKMFMKNYSHYLKK